MPDSFANFALSTLNGGAGGIGTALNSGDTSLLVQPGDGAKFPSTFPFMVLLGTLTGTHELVKATARSTDTLTIVRAQEGTSATTWAVTTTPVEAVVTAGNLNNKVSKDGDNMTGALAVPSLSVTGASSLDNGKLTTDGNGNLSKLANLATDSGTPGAPVLVKKGALTVSTTGQKTVLTYTPAADGWYRASGNLDLNNGTNGNQVTFGVSYTNAQGTGASRTNVFTLIQQAVSVLASGSNTANNNDNFSGAPITFKAAGSTAITVIYNDPTNTPNDIVTAFLEYLGS